MPTDLDGKPRAGSASRLLVDLKLHSVETHRVVLAHRPHGLLEKDLVQVDVAELYEGPRRISRLLSELLVVGGDVPHPEIVIGGLDGGYSPHPQLVHESIL